MIQYEKVNKMIEEGYLYVNKWVWNIYNNNTSMWSPDLSEAEARVEYFEKLIKERERKMSDDRRAKNLSR